MAGASTPGEASDNPVAINITALVDIIFCLCIFFFCSFHFRQLEGKFESWLPKERGVNATPPPIIALEDIRIFLKYNPNAADTTEAVRRQVMSTPVTSDKHLVDLILGLVANYKKLQLDDVPVIIDAEPLVPWKEVVNVLSLCRLTGLYNIEIGPAAKV